MGIEVTCNSCSHSFRAPNRAAGRKVKCPQCGRATPVGEAAPAEPPESKSSSVIPLVGTAGALCLTIGLIVGHLLGGQFGRQAAETEMRVWIEESLGAGIASGVQAAVEKLDLVQKAEQTEQLNLLRTTIKDHVTKELQNHRSQIEDMVASHSDAAPSPPPSRPSQPPTSPDSSAPATEPKGTAEAVYQQGQALTNDFYGLTLAQAEIGPVPLETILGESSASADDLLMLTLRVENRHDRKLLNVRRETLFSSHYSLTDDVGNGIRGVDFNTNKVSGAVLPTDDIEPGDSRTHIVVFTVPPPKTEYLILTVDLKSMLGYEGKAQFRIEAQSIQGFTSGG